MFIYVHLFICEAYVSVHVCTRVYRHIGRWEVHLEGHSSGAICLGCFALFKTGSFFLGLGLADYSKLAYLPNPGIPWSQPSGTHNHAQHSVGRFWCSNSGPLSTVLLKPRGSRMPWIHASAPLPPRPHLISSCPLFRPFLLASMRMIQIKLRLWLNISFQPAPNMAAGT